MNRSEFKKFYKESHDKWLRGEIGTANFADVLADELGLKEPKTKIVYEWIYLTISGSWFLASCIMTEEEASNTFKQEQYKKTGRSFEVPCD